MGLATAPRVFTKVLKPVFANLREKGHISTAYIDDSCLQGSSYTECAANIEDTVRLMDDLGLTVHPKKCVFIPTQQITFVGFILCSVTMIIKLTVEKQNSLIEACSSMLTKSHVSIRDFSKLIGKLVAAEPGVEYAPLYYKPLECVKNTNLRIKRGNFDAFMKIPSDLKPTLHWWITHTSNAFKRVSHGPPTTVIFTDSSSYGWGATNEGKTIRTGGVWDTEERKLHINILELKACQFALLSICKNIKNQHVRVYMDNTTSVSYVNKYGGKTTELNNLAREIWFWCLEHNIHLSAAHIPGKNNCEADKLSRNFNDDLEWSIEQNIFERFITIYGCICIDLFASRLNKKLEKYVSRTPEPDAFAVDAFSLTWNYGLHYLFPHFGLLTRVLKKVEEDQTEAVLEVPIWPTQNWWACLLHLISGNSYVLKNTQNILRLPHKPDHRHPLTKMKLGVFRISGKHYNTKIYRESLPISLSIRGDWRQRNNTKYTSKNGLNFHVKDRLIVLNQL